LTKREKEKLKKAHKATSQKMKGSSKSKKKVTTKTMQQLVKNLAAFEKRASKALS